MGLAKAAPNSLKDHSCKKIAIRECHVPEKDSVQETVSAYKDNHLKMLIIEGTELRVPIWHSSMRKAFLIRVGSAREVIEKKGYFKSYKEYSGTFADKRDEVKQLKEPASTTE
jgi:hypothetical protein